MERKKVILSAVLINAGLLAVLFIASLATHEEVVIPSGGEMASHMAEKSLFSEPAVMSLQEQIALPPVSKVEEKVEEPALVHKLPPLIPEETLAPAIAAVESALLEVVVKKGDTIGKIAKAHHVSEEEILKHNHLSSSFLKIGQVLKLPQSKGAKTLPKPIAVETQTNSEYYIVKVGDNPWTIAMKNHMKVEELLKLNGLNEEKARKLKAGDRLRIK